MSAACTGGPVSYLRLERYLLAELPANERAHVDAHLAGCAACRACLDDLRASEIALPALSALSAAALAAAPRLPARSAGTRLAWIGSGLAAAAIALLALRGGLAPVTTPRAVPDNAIKGGELTLELVRERGGDVARDPDTFLDGDRFAAFVSCAPGNAYWELAVFQAGPVHSNNATIEDRPLLVFFPLAVGGRLACGNAVQLPGAFLLSGTVPATVCVLIARDAPIDRARIAGARPSTLGFEHACTVVTPAPR